MPSRTKPSDKPIKPKRALVLSGGGVRGAYQIGVLRKWMCDDNIDYDFLCGVSVGALNVFKLATVPYGKPQEAYKVVESIWRSIRQESILCDWVPFGKLTALWKKSIYDARPMAKLISANYTPGLIKNSGKLLRLGAVCLNTGERKFVTEEYDNLDRWALASASFPVFMEPVKIQGSLWIDGGVKMVTPLGTAIRSGASDIDVILTSSPEKPKQWIDSNRWAAVPDIAMRCIDLMSDRIMLADIRTTGLRNDLVIIRDRYREINIRIIKPSMELTDDILKFDNADVQRMMKIGYDDACRE